MREVMNNCHLWWGALVVVAVLGAVLLTLWLGGRLKVKVPGGFALDLSSHKSVGPGDTEVGGRFPVRRRGRGTKRKQE